MSQMEIERRQDEAEAYIRSVVMKELCTVMEKTHLTPMVVLRLASRSIGSTYREMAEAHSGIDPCPCGWRPNLESDEELLGMALMTACEHQRSAELRTMRVAGNA